MSTFNFIGSGGGAGTYPAEGEVLDAVDYGPNGSEYTGDITLPTEAQVELGVGFGSGGAQYEGTLDPTGGDMALPATGFTESFTTGDDGDLEKGAPLSGRFSTANGITTDATYKLAYIREPWKMVPGTSLQVGMAKGPWTYDTAFVAGDVVGLVPWAESGETYYSWYFGMGNSLGNIVSYYNEGNYTTTFWESMIAGTTYSPPNIYDGYWKPISVYYRGCFVCLTNHSSPTGLPAWTTATNYYIGDIVYDGMNYQECNTDHTSSGYYLEEYDGAYWDVIPNPKWTDFSVDLAANKWILTPWLINPDNFADAAQPTEALYPLVEALPLVGALSWGGQTDWYHANKNQVIGQMSDVYDNGTVKHQGVVKPLDSYAVLLTSTPVPQSGGGDGGYRWTIDPMYNSPQPTIATRPGYPVIVRDVTA